MPTSPSLSPRVRQGLALSAAFAAGVLFSGSLARADQPYMQAALSQLQAAQASLQSASPNKGGHRDRALDLIAQAIDQVQQGINFANRN